MTIKIDFHLHTVSKEGGKDENFDFSLEWLKTYLHESRIDAFAVTNHNTFDISNFREILNEIDDVKVYPGMELDLISQNGKGHVNIIFPNDVKYLNELEYVSNKMVSFSKEDAVQVQDFVNWFPSYQDGIFVFETGKANSMREPVELSDITAVAGVQNGLKFQKIWNEEKGVVPVLFSDGHATENGSSKGRSDIDKLKEKNTYIQADNAEFSSIKNAIQNKNNVNIVPGLVHDTSIIAGVTVSTGLNLIVGRRGSGKTVFLDKIEQDNPGKIYRISQFESTKLDQFLAREQKDRGDLAIKKWEIDNQNVLEAIRQLIEDDTPSANIDNYLEKLKDYATDYVTSQTKNKVTLFSEQSFDILNWNWVESSLRNMKNIIDSNQVWNYIEDTSNYRNSLIELYEKVKNKYWQGMLDNRLKSAVNETIKSIKTYVQSITGQRILPELNFQADFRQRLLEKTLNIWGEQLSEDTVDEQLVWGYKIVTSINSYQTAHQLQEGLGKSSNTRVADALSLYHSGNLSDYLKLLKKRMLLNPSNLTPALVQRKTDLLTEDGKIASGGQAVALALTLSLEEATSKDIILVDEPEASLDNAFIKNKLIPKLQGLGHQKTVFVITHNSTLGTLLKPDYLIVAKKDEQGDHKIISGEYSSKILTGVDGQNYSSFDDFIDAMEAGFDTFKQKGDVYDELQNK
ncbi:MAG: hypothetical protein SOI57_04140 [Leuconostoc gelidum]|jgi:hypothetical protein|uniref:hypothetical protein n=1 Tax=Leuconostoc gelidum TaxID=1244 RepID=UPI001576A2D4|nr:hypothetical protein [Leuconostoc gelidum]MBZ5979421.1 hypothetical protein [Leuconostoc gelidum subsp. gelidum]MBZ6002305.1 hypothetical protein [Leuconostoc gelidum subsp. gelidum]QDJ30634.1 hypothetical protein BHS02_08375 [Leuconostoc gelidum subsp. gelidum]